MKSAMEIAAKELEWMINTSNANMRQIPGPVYNVKGYGAKGDGVTDDTAAIQAAINAADAAGGGIVEFGVGIFKYSTTIENPVGKPIYLRGVGSMPRRNNVNNAPFNPYTQLLWDGGSEPMVKITGAVGGCAIEGITLHGNDLASHGLILDTVQHSKFTDLSVVNTETAAIWLHVHSSAGNNANTQFNIFEKISVQFCPIGIILDSGSTFGSNTCHNLFLRTFIGYDGLCGVHYVNCDNNTFVDLFTFRNPVSTGHGIRLEPQGRSEYLYHYQGTVFGVEGTGGAMIVGYDRGNGQVKPQGDTSKISWLEFGGQANEWNIPFPITSPINNGNISIRGRTVEYSFSTTTTIAKDAQQELAPSGSPSGVSQYLLPFHSTPVAFSVMLTGAMTAGKMTVEIIDGVSGAIWSETITHPSGNNTYFFFRKSSHEGVTINSNRGLKVRITTDSNYEPETRQALVSVVVAI